MVYEYTGTNATGGKAYYYGLTLISQGNAAYYLYNGHGDVVQLVTSTGTLGRSYDYDAFGNEVSPSAGDTNPFRYAGQYYDTETGTYYLRARYYNPSIGRFTQQDGWAYADPRDPLSLNLYTYCFNNPIRYVDYSGNSVTDIIAGLSLSLDANLIGGFGKWLSEKMAGHYQYYAWDSEYDYYLGRVIGDAIGILVGAGMSVKGILDIVAAISSGAGVTIGSAGTAAIGGVAIAAAGVAAGVIEISYGATVVYAAASNFGDDWGKLQKSKKKNSESKNKKLPTGREFASSPKNAKEVTSYLEKNGFSTVGQEGSHRKMTNGINTIIVPMHGSKDLAIGTLRSIIKEAGLW